MGELFVIVLISAIVFGAIGSAIAKNKRVASNIGFLLGFFLGPIGLIVVALLNPTAETINPSSRFYHDRNLSSDPYRLWLTNKYGITRNDTLGRYTVDGNSFADLEEALHHADHLEDRQIESDASDAEQAAATRKRTLYALAAVAGCVALFFAAKGLLGYIQHRQAVQVATTAMDERRSSIVATLKSAGLSLIPSASMSSRDYTSLPVEELESQSFIGATDGVPSGEKFDPCSVDIASVPITDRSGKAVSFTTSDTPGDALTFYKANLARAGYTATSMFKQEYLDRLEYRNDRNVIFLSSIKPDDTPTIVTICILGRSAMDKIGADLASYNAKMAAAQARVDAANRALRRQLGMPEAP